MNGCAYWHRYAHQGCARRRRNRQRLYALSAWRETPFFTPRERAALAWTETLTNIQQGHASDEEYAAVRSQFDEAGLSALRWRSHKSTRGTALPSGFALNRNLSTHGAWEGVSQAKSLKEQLTASSRMAASSVLRSATFGLARRRELSRRSFAGSVATAFRELKPRWRT